MHSQQCVCKLDGVIMAEYSRMAKGSFTSNGSAKVINLPFQPDQVEFLNFTAAGTPANNGVRSAQWWSEMGQDTASAQYFNATAVLSSGNVAVGGISTFAAGQLLQYAASKQVIGITKASAASVNVTAHGYKSGDVVVFNGLYQSSTTGMPQIAGIPFTVTRVDADNFTIPWNSNQSNYTAISGSPAGSTVRKVLYPYLYFPGQSFISAITAPNGTTIPTGSVSVDTTAGHNMVVGQEVAFRIPSPWASVEFNSLPNILTPGAPVYGYVDAVTDYNTVIVRVANSATFTAFNSNQTVASTPGLSYAQIVAVGDVNTGGVSISSGSPLYPSPQYSEIGTTMISTINGPGIRGAYVNNTSQGFIIGAGSLVGLSSTVLVGADTNIIYWKAYLHDIQIP